MNSANLTRSDRLKRVDMCLSDGAEHSTMDIIVTAGVCAVNSIIAELRDNGRKIKCRRVGDRWLYKMEVEK